MKVFIATMIDTDIIADQSPYENGQDALWNGMPYKELESAKASCQEDVANFWDGEDPVPVLNWEEIDFGNNYKALRAKCSELCFEFLIREYDI